MKTVRTPLLLAIFFIAATATARDRRYTRHGAGPMYWMGYEECYVTDKALKEDRWQKSIDWVADNFRDAGYDMVCTDGWIEGAQDVDQNGYITKYNSDWDNGLDYWVKYAASKGLKSGIYYNPLWMTPTAYNLGMTIKDSNKTTKDIRGYHNFNDLIYWVDTDKEGAEQWVKGYVRHFINLGYKFLRIDFLSWYENAYGTERYKKALKWMCEEAGEEIFLSLVMPHSWQHAANELPYGDLIRVSEDVFRGGWDFISGRRRGVFQDCWAQWGNVFDALVKFSDIAGKGKMILDGDFIRLNTCQIDCEREFWISLMAISGSPIAIADQYDTGQGLERFYLNEEIIALNRAGFVGHPLSMDLNDINSSIWCGQLTDGQWVVGLFNREEKPRIMSVNFKDIGLDWNGEVRIHDMWDHTDIESCFQTLSLAVDPHSCRILRLSPNR